MVEGSTRPAVKRGKGRPTRGEPGVGRETVIAATRQLLKRLPPDKITRADLSREAGVDPSLVRYYFGNMSSLLSEVMHEIFNELQTLRASSPPQADFHTQLRNRIGALMSVLEENPYLHDLLVKRVVFGEDGKADEVDALRRDYTFSSLETLRAMLRRAEEAGESVPTDAAMLYMAIIGLSEFAVNSYPLMARIAPPTGDRAEGLARYADYVARLLVEGLRPRD